MDKELLFENLNRGMIEEKGRALSLNLEKNLDLIKKWGGLTGVVNEFQDKHVVIVGAGPSLDDNIEKLREIQKRQDLVIVAADMALKPLVLKGVQPRFVMTCETTPIEFLVDVDTSSMHLLAFSCCFHRNVRLWQGNMSFYNWMMDGEFFNNLWDRAGRELGAVATGSIVTTQAVSIALGCAVRSVVLVGNDMAFLDRYYAAGTISGEKLVRMSGRLSPLETLHVNQSRRARDFEIRRGGQSYYTNNQFLGAKMWLEDIFRSGGTYVMDCSVPGCSGNVVEKIHFGDFIKKLQVKRRKRR